MTANRSSDAVRILPAAYVALLLFLAPLKFGTVVETAGIPFFPLSFAEWLLTPWPPFLLPILAGVAAILAAAPATSSNRNAAAWLPVIVWCCALGGLLPGLVRTTEWDYAILFLRHVASAAALTMAVALILESTPTARSLLLGAAAAGVLWSASGGWLQVPFGGLTRTAARIEQIARQTGQSINPELLYRLHQNRAFSTFVYPNSFAAHLLLVSPAAIVLCYRAGNRFEPARISRALFGFLALVLCAGAVWFSGSRAALLAAAGGLGVGAFLHPAFRRWRVQAAAGALLIGIAGFSLLTFERAGEKLGSVKSRVCYYRAAVRMFAEEPVTGVGLGEFFPWYLRLKPAGAEESRQPHNLLLGFASQAGIAGGAAALVLLSLPLFLRYAWTRRNISYDAAMLSAVEIGLAAWCLHALVDFDVQIPGTVVTAAVLPLLALRPPPRQESRSVKSKSMLHAPVRWGAALLGLLLASGIARWPGEKTYARMWAATGTMPLADLHAAAEAASRRMPWNPYPWALLGRTADARDDAETSAAAWTEALLRTPHRAAFHRAAAEAYLRLGNRDQAAHHARIALEWYPTDPDVHNLARRLGIRD